MSERIDARPDPVLRVGADVRPGRTVYVTARAVPIPREAAWQL